MKTKPGKSLYFVEMTDTYGGEANYCWVNRFIVSAASERGAIGMVTRKTGYHARSVGCDRYDVPRCHICYFIEWVDSDRADEMINHYSKIEVLP